MWFLQGNAEFGDLFPKPTKRTSAPRKFAEPGSVLLSVRAPVGATNLAPERIAIGRGLTALVPKAAIHPRFLLWLLRGHREDLVCQATGTTFSAVTGKVVRGLEVTLPPLEEQLAIVATVEHCMRAIDRGTSRVGVGLQRIEALRAAVLRDAFDLELDTAALGELADIASGVTKGRKLTEPTVETPFLRAANIRDGFLDLDEIHTIPATTSEVQRLELQAGDVLLVEGSGSPARLGQGWIWDGQIERCIHQNHVFRARPDRARVLPRFLAWVLQSPRSRAYFRSVTKTTSGLATINRRQVLAAPVPVMPLERQEGVVAHVEEQLAAAHRLASALSKAQQRAERLRTAVLHRALSGQLTERLCTLTPVHETLRRNRSSGIAS